MSEIIQYGRDVIRDRYGRGVTVRKPAEMMPRVPSVPAEAWDVPNAPPIASQEVESYGYPNIPTAYERPGTWPADRPLASIPSVAGGLISGPGSVHPQEISVLCGSSSSESRVFDTQSQPRMQPQRQVPVKESRANHWPFGQRLLGQQLPMLRNIRQRINSVISGR